MEPNAFKKSPNQNICSQILSRLARFLESGDKFAEVATLVFAVLFNQPLQGYKRSQVLLCLCLLLLSHLEIA